MSMGQRRSSSRRRGLLPATRTSWHPRWLCVRAARGQSLRTRRASSASPNPCSFILAQFLKRGLPCSSLQERLATNRVYVFLKNVDRCTYFAEIKSQVENSARNTSTCAVMVRGPGDQEGALYVRIPYINEDVPLFIVFRALGVETDEEAMKHILYKASLGWVASTERAVGAWAMMGGGDSCSRMDLDGRRWEWLASTAGWSPAGTWWCLIVAH